MSAFPAYPPYGTYQASYAAYQSPHYPSQYPPNAALAPFPPLYTIQPKAPTPELQLSTGEDALSVTPDVASRSIQRLIVAQLRQAQFDTAEPLALQRLESEVVAFVHLLYERAHEYANLANRAMPVAKDLFLACEEQNLKSKDMHKVVEDFWKSDANKGLKAPELILPPPRSPSPVLLPSDDEGAPPYLPLTLRSLPSGYPPLPPKHTYLKTPPSPPKKAALPSLEKKLKNASLVQESLKNLLLATEENVGQEDGELLGHIVNWESSTYKRKRWKVGN